MNSNEWLMQARTDLEAMLDEVEYRICVARKHRILYPTIDFKRTYEPLKQMRDHLEWAHEAMLNIADIGDIDRAIQEREGQKPC